MNEARALEKPLPPGSTIGILGGGQLGRMLALAAARLGLKAHIFSDETDAPAFQVASARTCAGYENGEALRDFAAASDAITFEFENVPSATVALLAHAKPANPNARALAVSQDRFSEKRFVSGLGLRTAEFAKADSEAEARGALRQIGTPAILKTRRLGYDGKGQARITNADELWRAFETLLGAPAILERCIDFAFETSVIVARSSDGNFAAYDSPMNIHADGILKRSIVPAPLSDAQSQEAVKIGRILAEALDYIGVLCVELFVAKDGELLVNEIAPRVHNSGHWTLEACAVSQFEQHIRAIAGWPLGDPARHSDAVMENLIGEEARDWLSVARAEGALHLYGKSEIRAGRKMGHITRLLPKNAAGCRGGKKD